MHELGIAASALELALEQARAAGASQILGIVIRVGVLSGVEPEALRFAFTAILPGTAAEGATLHIDPVPVVAYCAQCQQDFTPADDLIFECPVCGCLGATIKHGRELELTRLEIR